MRLAWYAGASTALAASVILSAFHQRANFYSAMVYLAQSNFCLLILVNFMYLIYGSFIYGLQRVFYGPLRQVEVEQLSEKAWFAITETCLAMTIFRDEIGAWFLVMFTALVTGKVWGWIGDGRVEVLEQQPPTNPSLFHTRLSISLVLSMIYDTWLLSYTVNTVIQQAKPNMMVMFLFEFAVLATSSARTSIRYVVSVMEARIIKTQTRERLEERRREVREQREELLRQREEQHQDAETDSHDLSELPREEDVDEMDIEVPGWESKGQWILALDLITDGVKLIIYVAFFAILLTFYGLPIHIMRDLFMTARSFIKRGSALYRYRKAVEDMNRYPDATVEELTREDTCIICREEMRPWNPVNNPSAVERTRPKKLPCGHILHFGCLKSWLERQQVCPTCRNPVIGSRPQEGAPDRDAALARIGLGGLGGPGGPIAAAAQQQAPIGEQVPDVQQNPRPQQQQQLPAQQAPRIGAVRMFNLGPIRLGFAQGAENMQELAHRMDLPAEAIAGPLARAPQSSSGGPSTTHTAGSQLPIIRSQIRELDQLVQREIQTLQITQVELQTIQLLTAEIQRLRQLQQHHDQGQQAQTHSNLPFPTGNTQLPQQPIHSFPYPAQFQLPQMPLPQAIRISTPTVSRHGAAPFTNAIPAGSSELPEGVVIPPGWSLLPLQRLDGAPATLSTPISGENAHSAGNETVSASIAPNQPTPGAEGSNGPNNVPWVGRATSTTRTNEPTQASETTITDTSTSVQSMATMSPGLSTDNRDATPVLSPNPVAPSWAGTNQLFANDRGVNRLTHESQSTPPIRSSQVDDPVHKIQAAESSSMPASQEDDLQSNVGNKGKGKAVTVEEGSEEDSEED